MNILDELDDFINKTKESKEIKRALAVNMILSGKSYREIKELLNVSKSFIYFLIFRNLFSTDNSPIKHEKTLLEN